MDGLSSRHPAIPWNPMTRLGIETRNSRNIELGKHKIRREKAGKPSYTELANAY
jgi:hypothetical protein